MHISPSFVISLTYGESHFVPFGDNKISSRENHIPKERVSGISCFHDVSHCDAPPSAETQVMHFIARFNSSVRLFNQTSLPAGAKRRRVRPFSRATRRGCGMEGAGTGKPFRPQNPTFVLSALRTHPRASSRVGWSPVKRPDNVGSRYNTYFSGHLSGFASGVPDSFARIHLDTTRQYVADRLARGSLLTTPVCVHRL